MDPVNTDASAHLIEEDRLRQISRAVRQHVPSDAAVGPLSDQINLPSLNGSHRVAAWNTLCSLVDQSLQSKESAVKDHVWDCRVCDRALTLFLDHCQSAKPKSSRQLVVTLTNAMRSQPDRDWTDSKRHAIEKLLLSLMDYESPHRAKVSAQLLSNLLQKDVISLEMVLKSFTHLGNARTTPLEGSVPKDLLLNVFSWLSKGDFGASIATLVSVILDKLDELPPPDSTLDLVWVEPLVTSISHDAVHVDDLRAHLFPVLFKRNFSDFVSLLDNQGLTTGATISKSASSRSDILHAALQTGKELGMLYETASDELSYTATTLLLPLRYIEGLLFQNSRSARLTGLYLLINSHSSTRPLSEQTLLLLRRSLATFFADVDADFRSGVFGAFQRLIDRMRSMTKALAHPTSTPTKQQILEGNDDASRTATFRYYTNFLQWLLRFLCWELRPTASYQRHISALKCLSILAQSGLDKSVPADFLSKSALRDTKWPFEMQVLTLDLQQLLLNLLLDPFDDVRQTSASILRFFCVGGEHEPVNSGIYVQACQRAERKMYLTSRADQADGVAHLYALVAKSYQSTQSGSQVFNVVQKLESLLSIAETDLVTAVERYPLHGLLTSLKYIVSHSQGQYTESLQGRLFNGLHRVWQVVKPVLCNDAPEGYIPDELEYSQDSTKETLSYCWRALKESSLLLSTMASMERDANESSRLESMSRLCFTQLAELRHRGAFSTVAQTWVSVCTRCKDLRSSEGTPLLQLWYGEVLEMLRTNVTINTRRSAGLPSLLCGILIADVSGCLIAQAFADLQAISRQSIDADAAEEGSLAQVHAMNCQKDMLKNSRLGEHTERYIPASLRLAADALQSDAWAIRNCGLMLFRAVIDRLLGTSEAHLDDSQSQKRISIEQHPQLLDVVLGLLTPPIKESSARYEGVFPALQMLQLIRVPQERLIETRIAVGVLAAVPSWHVRDKAARTLASLTTINELSQQLRGLLEADDVGENALQGSLLSAKYTLIRTARQTTKSTDSDRASIVDCCGSIAIATGRLFTYAYSPVAHAAAMGLMQECSALLATIDRSYHQERLMTALWAATAPDGVHGIFQGILQPRLQDPSAAVVRQAWARLLAQYLAASEQDAREHSASYHSLLVQLSSYDADACKHFLLAVQFAGVDATGPISALVVLLCTDIMSGHLDVELKCEAQKTLILLSEKSSSPIELPSKRSEDYLAEKDSNQRYADQWLLLHSIQLGSQNQNHNMHEQMIFDISTWAEECVAAINGSGIHTREAAAEALDRVRTLWSTLRGDETLRPHFLRLYIAVYDLLNDDDEDIRLQASRITSRVLATNSEADIESLEFEPIVASQKLLRFCVRIWPANNELIATAFLRAFNIAETEPQAIAEQLTEAMHSDTALFAEEKQNLYIDEAREVRVWSQVIPKLTLQSIPKVLVDRLARWVSDGLKTLTAHAQNTADGALGWSTNSDVFTLGLQVFHGAEVLLRLSEQGVRIPLPPSEVREKLVACLGAFELGGPDDQNKSQVNCLWRWEIERVLTDSVAKKVDLVSGVANYILRREGSGEGMLDRLRAS